MKVVVIGLDSLDPDLTFEKWIDYLPNLRSLMEDGVWGFLESTIPPITVPAWATMLTSKDPGVLGFYGFRNRIDYSYKNLGFVNSKLLNEKTIWDRLGEIRKKSIVIGVPPSYPPLAINGVMLSCFLTPGPESEYTYPKALKHELEAIFGPVILDVKNFRTEDKEWLLREIYKMTEQRFKIAEFLAKNVQWDFFIFVDMGPDRIHHGFWSFMDKEHRNYVQGNQYEDAIFEYYKFLDKKVGEFLDNLSSIKDPFMLIVVSDHGAKRMDGGIAIHDWLIDEGYLVLKEGKPNTIKRLTPEMVDWEKTMAWSEGGYYARIFLNVKDREPSGVIRKGDYEKIREEMKTKLENLTDESGKHIGTRVYIPEEIYKKTNNIPPDLIVLFGDLYWRSIGSVGYDKIWVYENDTGPDDANHSQHGMFIIRGPLLKVKGKRIDLRIYDIGATILKAYGIYVDEEDFIGNPLEDSLMEGGNLNGR